MRTLIKAYRKGNTMKPTLLVATDFSQNSIPILQKAIELASTMDGIVHVVHVVESSFFTLKNKEYIHLQCLEKITKEIPSFVKEHFHCVEGELKSSIAEVAKAINATLLIIENNQNKYLAEKIFIGSDVQSIIKQAGIPVLVFKHTHTLEYKSILILTDLSDTSAQFIKHIATLFPKARLTLLHLWNLPVEFRLSLYGLEKEDIEEFKQRCFQDTNRAIERFVEKNALPKERIHTLLLETLAFETLKEINPEMVAMHTSGAISLFAFNLLKESFTDVLIHKVD
jgi:nucleotide-binding universal stress UspA family protein